jgi:Domain of unknown function (DUF4440)
MKSVIFALSLILSSTICQGQNTFPYGGSPDDQKTLRDLNNQHAAAFANGDRAILQNKILAEDFMLIASNGQLQKKQEVLYEVDASAALTKNIASHALENVIIRFVAPDVAMVHARIKFTMKDGTVTPGIQYNDIYAKRSGQWVCVSGNNSPVAAGN